MRHIILKSHYAFRIWLGVCLTGLVLAGSLAKWSLIRNRNVNRHLVAHLGHGGYLAYDALQSLKAIIDEQRLGSSDTDIYVNFLQHVARANREATPSPPPTSAEQKNVIFIQMESVDGFSVQALYREQPIMPFLYDLRNRSINFINTSDNTSGGRTTDAEFLALASLPPLSGKPIYVNYDLDQVPSLPKALNQAGYYTFSIHGYIGAFWNRAHAHEQLGYQDSFFISELDASDKIGWGISDHAILQQAADKIVSSAKPVFAHIILLTNHHPYHHVGRKRGHVKPTIVENHIESLGYTDSSIAAFFARLDEYEVLDDCLIAIYGDHDSSLSGALLETVELDTPPLLIDSVPLMLVGFSHPSTTMDKIAGLQDLPVIALNELGVPVPHTFSGNALLSDLPNLHHTGIALSNHSGVLERRPAPINVNTLTKLALLYPERLEYSP